jgi:hypothetical protein
VAGQVPAHRVEHLLPFRRRPVRREIPSELLPDENPDLLFLIYAVSLPAKGADVSAEDVHNAWAAWMTHLGKQHDALVPFAGSAR